MIGLALSIFSCKKEEAPVFVDSPVVESYLKPGDSLSVTISRQVAFATNAIYSSENLDSLSVSVTINNNDYLLSPQGNGIYKSNYIVQEGDEYRLHFMFNGQAVSASTTIPSQPSNYSISATTLSIPQMNSSNIGNFTMPDPVELNWDNNDGSYYLVVVENIETNPTPIRDTTGGDGPPDRVFRNQPTTSNTYEIRAMQFQYYGTHRIILFHLNPDYAFLYSDNNSSSQNLSTPQTAITNGLGIFTGINADTLMLEVTQ